MLAPEALRTSQRVPQFLGGGEIGWRERPVPRPGPGELLIRIRANALCGTDRSLLMRGSAVTPGHEASGEVALAGPASSVPVGTPGVVYLMDFCGNCRSCRDGATNQCQGPRANMGFDHDGGLGRYELIHESCFYPVPASLDPGEATLLLDVMGTTGHALSRALAVRPETRSFAIGGAGPIGLGLVAMIRLRLGWEVPIVVTDVVDYRLKLAQRLGAEPVNVGTRGVGDALPYPDRVDGFDICIDSTGREAVRRALLNALDRRGVLVCVGHGEGLTLSVSEDLIAPERSILGSEYFPFGDLAANLVLLLEHRDYLEEIITHRFGVEDVEEAYRLFLAGETGKVVIEQ